MKKIYLTIIALIATLAISAQVEEFQMEYVDLGLPSGTLWATCNVGAKSPEQIGTFYAWGETEPKDDYELGNYKWMTKAPASEFQYEKYIYADGQTSASWYNGNSFIGDGKTELEIEEMPLLPTGDVAGVRQAMNKYENLHILYVQPAN